MSGTSNGTSVELTAPIKAHGEELTQLSLREPSTKDLIEVGQPFLIVISDGDSKVEIRNKTVAQYIVRLAGIPMTSVEQLSRGDFAAVQAAVLGFFGTSADGQAPN